MTLYLIDMKKIQHLYFYKINVCYICGHYPPLYNYANFLNDFTFVLPGCF